MSLAFILHKAADDETKPAYIGLLYVAMLLDVCIIIILALAFGNLK